MLLMFFGILWRRRRDLSKYGSHQFLNWWLQQFTGLLHLFFKSLFSFSVIRKTPIRLDWGFLMAEKEGFEPSIPFWGIHDFQSCALGQLRDFSKCISSCRLAHNTPLQSICQALFLFFSNFFSLLFSGGRTWFNGQTGFGTTGNRLPAFPAVPGVFPAPQYDRPS